MEPVHSFIFYRKSRHLFDPEGFRLEPEVAQVARPEGLREEPIVSCLRGTLSRVYRYTHIGETAAWRVESRGETDHFYQFLARLRRRSFV